MPVFSLIDFFRRRIAADESEIARLEALAPNQDPAVAKVTADAIQTIRQQLAQNRETLRLLETQPVTQAAKPTPPLKPNEFLGQLPTRDFGPVKG